MNAHTDARTRFVYSTRVECSACCEDTSCLELEEGLLKVDALLHVLVDVLAHLVVAAHVELERRSRNQYITL